MTPRNPLQYAAFVRILLGAPKTTAERVIVNLSGLSTSGLALGFALWAITGVSKVDSTRLNGAQRGAIAVTAISAVLFILTLTAGGLLVVGRRAGRPKPLQQVGYTFGRVFLLIFLPCLIITIILIVVAVATNHAPGLTNPAY